MEPRSRTYFWIHGERGHREKDRDARAAEPHRRGRHDSQPSRRRQTRRPLRDRSPTKGRHRYRHFRHHFPHSRRRRSRRCRLEGGARHHLADTRRGRARSVLRPVDRHDVGGGGRGLLARESCILPASRLLTGRAHRTAVVALPPPCGRSRDVERARAPRRGGRTTFASRIDFVAKTESTAGFRGGQRRTRTA